MIRSFHHWLARHVDVGELWVPPFVAAVVIAPIALAAVALGSGA